MSGTFSRISVFRAGRLGHVIVLDVARPDPRQITCTMKSKTTVGELSAWVCSKLGADPAKHRLLRGEDHLEEDATLDAAIGHVRLAAK